MWFWNCVDEFLPIGQIQISWDTFMEIFIQYSNPYLAFIYKNSFHKMRNYIFYYEILWVPSPTEIFFCQNYLFSFLFIWGQNLFRKKAFSLCTFEIQHYQFSNNTFINLTFMIQNLEYYSANIFTSWINYLFVFK